MVKLRTYAKDGTEMSASGGVSITGLNAGIDHIDGDLFAFAHERGRGLFRYDGVTGSDMVAQTLYSSAGVVLKSVALNRSHGDVFNDGVQELSTVSVNQGEAGKEFRILSHDRATGFLLWQHSFGIQAGFGGITTNGHQWFVSYTNTAGGTHKLLRLEIDGLTVSTVFNHTMNRFIRDMCFDGHSLWTIEGVENGNLLAYQYHFGAPGTFPNSVVQSWTPSGATHFGIAEDGNNIIICSDT